MSSPCLSDLARDENWAAFLGSGKEIAESDGKIKRFIADSNTYSSQLKNDD